MEINVASLPKYDPVKLCPKCGNSTSSASAKYCPGKGLITHIPGCEVDGEHLHRKCAKCGYEWLAQPLDYGVVK